MKKKRELFVDSQFVENLTKGSFENTQQQVLEALQARPEFKNVVLLATFKNSAVVLLPESRIIRVQFSTERTGITLREHQQLELPTVSQEEVRHSLQQELSEACALYMAGRPDVALEKVGKLLPMVAEARSVSYYVAKLESIFDEPTKWEKVLRESSMLVSVPEKLSLEISEDASPRELETQQYVISESGQSKIVAIREQIQRIVDTQGEEPNNKDLVHNLRIDVNRKLYCAKQVFDRGTSTQEDIKLMVEVYNSLAELSSKVESFSELLRVVR